MFAQCSTSFFAQIFHHLHTYRVLEVAREREVPFQATRLETKEEAQNAPTPVTTYALFYNGEYLTNEQIYKASGWDGKINEQIRTLLSVG